VQPSAVHVLKLWFTKMSLVENIKFTKPSAVGEGNEFPFGPSQLSSKVGIVKLRDETDYSDFRVVLELLVEDTESSLDPYLLDITASGLFRVTVTVNDTSPNDIYTFRNKLALVNGAGILYSAIREMVSNVSCRSINGNLLLPAMSFTSLAKQAEDSKKIPTQIKPASLKKKAAKSSTGLSLP
jgi:preprotein translocase subunit SecB